MKVVINRCYGGFSLSEKAYEELEKEWDGFGFAFEDDRTNPQLIGAMERLGSEVMSGEYANLEIVEIPDDVQWEISEYNGYERVEKIHRSWPDE